jgi:hypothetical protein
MTPLQHIPFTRIGVWLAIATSSLFVANNRSAKAEAVSWINAVNASTPSVWYRFNETSGSTTAIDYATGNGSQDGTYAGGITYQTAGASGSNQGVLFNGTTGTVRATNVPIATSFSIETWVRSVPAVWDAYGGLGASREANGFLFHPDGGGVAWRAFVYNDPDDGFHQIGSSHSPASINDKYHQYVMTYDHTTGFAATYFDGAMVSSTTFSLTRNNDTLNIIDIARDYNQAGDIRFSNIYMDEWILFNRTLSGGEVLAHFNAIPEPSSIFLTGIAFAVTLVSRRRKIRIVKFLVVAATCGCSLGLQADTISWVNAINASNPSTWYQFEETSGGTTADVATTGTGVDGVQDGTYNVGTGVGTFTAGTAGVTRGVGGLIGNAATFDGTSGFLQSTGVPVQASFSIEMIVRSDSANWNINGGLASALYGGNTNGFALHPYSGGHRVDAYVADNVGGSLDFDAYVVQSPGPANITTYHHYVMTYDDPSGVVALYIDNSVVTSSYTLANKPVRGSTTNTIDLAHYYGTSFLSVATITIDEFVLYNRGLSAVEVGAHFDAITAVATPEPSAFALAILSMIGLIRVRRCRSAK